MLHGVLQWIQGARIRGGRNHLAKWIKEVTTPTRKVVHLGDVYKKLQANPWKKMQATFFASYFIVFKKAVSRAHRKYVVYLSFHINMGKEEIRISAIWLHVCGFFAIVELLWDIKEVEWGKMDKRFEVSWPAKKAAYSSFTISWYLRQLFNWGLVLSCSSCLNSWSFIQT